MDSWETGAKKITTPKYNWYVLEFYSNITGEVMRIYGFGESW